MARQQSHYKERRVLERRLRRAGIKALEPRAGRAQEPPERRPLDHSSSPEVFLSASASSLDHRPELVTVASWRVEGRVTDTMASVRREEGVESRTARASTAAVTRLPAYSTR